MSPRSDSWKPSSEPAVGADDDRDATEWRRSAPRPRRAVGLAPRGLRPRPVLRHKCGYCDFASLAGVDHLADRYLAALEREMAALGGAAGGRHDLRRRRDADPARRPASLDRLLAMIRRWFPLAPGGEWTVEANPGTLDAEKADVLAAGGVNRVSLGAQSFQPELLQALERNHAPDEVARRPRPGSARGSRTGRST